MGFSKNTMLQALQEKENNQIKVAYQLVLDHKRMISAGICNIIIIKESSKSLII